MFYIIAIASLVILVALHEMGHFLIAKFFNVRVDEFGIGIPPRLFGKKIGETVYSLNLLPIGAFVKIFGEEERIDDERSFSQKSIFQRAMIILGGVIAFWVVAFVILTIVMILGIPSVIDDVKVSPDARVVLMEVVEGMPAHEAELLPGDTIEWLKSYNEQNEEIVYINKAREVQDFLLSKKNQDVIIAVDRGGESYQKIITPNEEGLVGVGLLRTEIISYPFYIAPFYGGITTLNLTHQIATSFFGMFKNIFSGKSLPKDMKLVGPVGIVSEIAVSALQQGITHYLWIISVIAVSLAIINLFPIPALDGGRFLFLLFEKIKGKPLNQKTEQSLISVSFIILLLLFIVVTFQDIQRIIFK